MMTKNLRLNNSEIEVMVITSRTNIKYTGHIKVRIGDKLPIAQVSLVTYNVHFNLHWTTRIKYHL